MKNPLRRRPNRWPFAALLLSVVVASEAAVVPTEWQFRQPVTVPAAGLMKLPVSARTFDAAQPQLTDLRLLDSAGQEVPYLLDREVGNTEQPAAMTSAKAFRSSTVGDTTQLVIETGTSGLLDSIHLESSIPFFLKAAHVEISADGVTWQSLGAALPVFRQFGAEQLRLPLARRAAAFVRVTIDDFRSRQIAFSGAKLLLAPTRPAPPPLAPLGATIARRDEFAGETLLTVTLDGRHVLLAGLTFEAKEPLFMRRVTVAVREAHEGVSTERTIGSGTIYRVALDGAPARSELRLPLNVTPLTRELIVHISNGDSPPLSLESVQAQQHPVNLHFLAPAAGAYTLLSGNAQATSPRYDLAAFGGELRGAGATALTAGELEAMPNYRARESLAASPLPDVPLLGAPLDTADWPFRKTIQIERSGVQELELDLEALAHARPGFADLRLIRDGNQIPYVLEQPALARALALKLESIPDAKRPHVSVWRIELPQKNLPLQRLILSSTTALFRRELRIFERLTDQNGAAYENQIAAGTWSRTPEAGVPETRVFELSNRPRTNFVWIESDNGDNPPIEISAVQVTYPVVRLIFKTAETEGFALTYGNRAINAPRYDLSLVAAKLVTSSRNVAQLAVSQTTDAAKKSFGGMKGGYVFWGALALVVVLLLVLVAKLLPKPAAP